MPERGIHHREAVYAALNHGNPSHVPRGELFFSRKFLDVFFPQSRGDYVGQLASAAHLLGLSVVGVDLNEKWSRFLLREGNYRRLVDYFTVGSINGPVLHAIARLGFRQAMICMKKDHQILLDIASSLVRDVEEICARARENEFSAILLADDIAGNRGLFFSYNDFSGTFLPLYKQIAGTIKRNGLYAFFHSDGDTRDIIESLIEAGYDCIHPVDAEAGLSLYELKKTFGNKVSFMGHIDIINLSGEQIAREVGNAENYFREGGLILGSTCGLSMKTVSGELSALYPQWERWEQEA
jgi:uroporphyrinogen decarboxylase